MWSRGGSRARLLDEVARGYRVGLERVGVPCGRFKIQSHDFCQPTVDIRRSHLPKSLDDPFGICRLMYRACNDGDRSRRDSGIILQV